MMAWMMAAALAAAPVGAQTPPAPEGACDRACMNVVLDRFLDSIVQHDPALATLGKGYRATENGHVVPPGGGLWRSATGLGPLQRRYFDPDTQQAAFYGSVLDPSGPALLSVRLKLDGRAIVESEAIVARKGEPLWNVSGAVRDQPRRDGAIPPAKAAGRADLIRTATAYFDALGSHDGSKIPKVDGCDRVENGTRVTNRPPRPGAPADEFGSGDCTAGFASMAAIAGVAHRRFLVDTQAGVVLGIGMFQRPPGATWRDGSPRKRNLIHEYFAMDKARLTQIFAVMRYVDVDEPDGTGWPDGR